MLKCTKCGKEKSIDEFSFDKARKTGRTAWCKVCKTKSAGEYYNKNRVAVLKKLRDAYAKDSSPIINASRRAREGYRKAWLTHLPNGGKVSCSACGYDKCFAAIDFHHLRDKEYSISALMSNKPTPERIKALKLELEKCIVLCANCHREVHFNRNLIPQKE